MTCVWRSTLGAAVFLAAARPATAQRLEVPEVGVQATATAADPALAVGGAYAAYRVSSRARIAAQAGIGTSDEEFAWRGELLAHFLLSPNRLEGPGFYAGGGVAAVGGPAEHGYLVLLIGVEAEPGRSTGWAAELGVGGGLRLSVGYRWRFMPLWWGGRE